MRNCCCKRPAAHEPAPAQIQCCHCCQRQRPAAQNQKIRGKFGVAYVIETGTRKSKPCGWEIEFNDTPSQIENNCKRMMDWISCPPLGKCADAAGSEHDCQCTAPEYSECLCRQAKRYECSCCNNTNKNPSKGQKMYFSSKNQCCQCCQHLSDQSEASVASVQGCQCCRCARKVAKSGSKGRKPSKNCVSADSSGGHDGDPMRALYATSARAEPKKGPDKMTEGFEVRSSSMEEVEIKSEEIEPTSITETKPVNISLEEESLVIPDIFNVDIDPSPQPPPKRMKRNELLKLIKKEQRKEMEAIHPTKQTEQDAQPIVV